LEPNPNNDLRTIKLTVTLVNCTTPITDFSGFINIYDIYGNCTSSTRVSGSLFYTYTWTLTKPITSTIEESICFTGGSVTQSLQTFDNPNMIDYRTNQIGGSYNSIINAMGGERHHLIAQQVINSSTIYRYDANKKINGTVTTGTMPCVLLTVADHQKTSSYKSSAAAVQYRADQLALVNQGKYIAALQMDIDDIHRNIGNKYDIAISQAWVYMTSLGWYQ
jgi:hypothetical protein